MKLSAKAEYGVRMMADLAAAYGQGPLPLSQIAERQGISADFLEQLTPVLRRKGLVESVRGAHGGYQLARAPEGVTVGEIIEALEGPFVPMMCLEVQHEAQPGCCSRLGFCTTRDVWVRLRDQVNATLNAITLADLANPQPDHPAYVIVPHADGAAAASGPAGEAPPLHPPTRASRGHAARKPRSGRAKTGTVTVSSSSEGMNRK